MPTPRRGAVSSHPVSARAWRLKRGFDLVVSLALLVVLSPLLLLVAVLVRLESPGPALFRQRRAGFDERRRRIRWFTFYKFRTMAAGSDPGVHREHVRQWSRGLHSGRSRGINKLEGDPRVTPLGRILRRTSIDELPQLWNVLLGDMSLVGPRPVPDYEVEVYRRAHRGRLLAKPGITGLWQVTGRGVSSLDEMALTDLEYIAHQTFWLDLWILMRTVPVVLLCRGAQ